MTELLETHFHVKGTAEAIGRKRNIPILHDYDDLGPIEYLKARIPTDAGITFEVQSRPDSPLKKQYAQILSSDPENYTAIAYLLYILGIGPYDISVTTTHKDMMLRSLDLLVAIVEKFNALRSKKMAVTGVIRQPRSPHPGRKVKTAKSLRSLLESNLYREVRKIEGLPLSQEGKVDRIRRLGVPPNPPKSRDSLSNLSGSSRRRYG